jgi:hypothetical protein
MMCARLPASLAACLLAAAPAWACLACLDSGAEPAFDRLVAAEAVVIAGGDERPSVLAGTATGANLEAAAAAARGERAVVARDAAGEWHRVLAYAPGMRPVVEAILAAAPDWRAEPEDEGRSAYLAALHDHPARPVRALAAGALAREPYGRLRSIRPGLDRAALVRALREGACADWRRVHVLFLELDGSPEAVALVRRGFAAATPAGGAQDIEAWAVALLEVGGARAVDALGEALGDTPGAEVRDEVRRGIVWALAVQGREGDPALRPAVAAVFRGLAAHPGAAAHAARYLAWAQDWSQAEAFAAVLHSGRVTEPADAFVISMYLEGAREAGAGEP